MTQHYKGWQCPTTVGECLAASQHCVDDQGYLYVVADEYAVIRYGGGESLDNTVEHVSTGLPYRDARARGATPVTIKSVSIQIEPGYENTTNQEH